MAVFRSFISNPPHLNKKFNARKLWKAVLSRRSEMVGMRRRACLEILFFRSSRGNEAQISFWRIEKLDVSSANFSSPFCAITPTLAAR